MWAAGCIHRNFTLAVWADFGGWGRRLFLSLARSQGMETIHSFDNQEDD
ncbi:hypothetical protein EVA_19730, partial [gut metagenome]